MDYYVEYLSITTPFDPSNNNKPIFDRHRTCSEWYCLLLRCFFLQNFSFSFPLFYFFSSPSLLFHPHPPLPHYLLPHGLSFSKL